MMNDMFLNNDNSDKNTYYEITKRRTAVFRYLPIILKITGSQEKGRAAA